ncbi:ABC transporter ATP-binding protein [Desulfatitalea alkaliphila]|uniref:ABC transporter ATP-binding protein n=1 Tax=Desulfatitalea alkaliphila TaxID=2929485 RepID=A0AA41R498_9BACT|nr:ABC transporter ATP-binding protein [Desulfatitalea alkaliphila]MCJ8503057.1 ABC transporter ATP-binding protein [Desulfatitalea alkaliphila]
MIIQIDNLTKWYRKGRTSKVPAVDNLTLAIAKGEVFGFLGPNGAGKSTVIKILLNFIRPSAGTAMIKGIPVQDPLARGSIGYLPENPYFYDHLTAEEILMFGGRTARMDRNLIGERIDQLLARLKLAHVKRQRIRTYSKGMVQRIGLALALIHDPEVCILDEPMSGLDPLGRRLVADLILDMRRNGRTVFFSSHILSDIEKLCDRVGILNRGRLLYCGNTDTLQAGAGGLEKMFIQLVEQDERENHGADLAIG